MSRNDLVPKLFALEIKTQPTRPCGLGWRTSLNMPSTFAVCELVFVSRRAEMRLRVLIRLARLRQSRPLDRDEPLVVGVTRVNEVCVRQIDRHSVRLDHATSDRPAAAEPVMIKEIERPRDRALFIV